MKNKINRNLVRSPARNIKKSLRNCLFLRSFFPSQGNLVAVGTHRGYVQVWDVAASKKLNVLEGHSARVGALAWNGDSLSSGSRDRLILQRDIRMPPLTPVRRLEGHRQEVCGLKWSPDNAYLVRVSSEN
jgi:cell division cycle 20-like protein 1 (cofactor of APC complex)